VYVLNGNLSETVNFSAVLMFLPKQVPLPLLTKPWSKIRWKLSHIATLYRRKLSIRQLSSNGEPKICGPPPWRLGVALKTRHYEN